MVALPERLILRLVVKEPGTGGRGEFLMTAYGADELVNKGSVLPISRVFGGVEATIE